MQSTPASVALGAKLIQTVPGFTLQPFAVGDTGPSDLNKAADDDGKPGAKAALQSAGFVVGYQNLFDAASPNTQVIVFVYQFRTHAGAEQYFARQSAGLDKPQSGVTPTPVPLTGIPGAVAYQATEQGRHGSVAQFVTGTYHVYLVVSGSATDSTLPNIVTLANEQFARLG